MIVERHQPVCLRTVGGDRTALCGNRRRRLALKMWTGWPTFPMVFVKGVLIGGASDLAKLIESGELPRKR